MRSPDGDSNRHGGGEDRPEELIAQAKTGSNSTLGRALDVCRSRLLLVARSVVTHRLRPQVGASDVVPDTFVNATKAFGVFQGQKTSEFPNWLHRILFNRMAEIARKGGHRPRGVAHVSLGDMGGQMNHRSLADEPSPSSLAGDQEFAELIRAELARLSQRDQEVLRLRYNEGPIFPQIGERVSLIADGARMLFVRAVKRLKRELPGECDC